MIIEGLKLTVLGMAVVFAFLLLLNLVMRLSWLVLKEKTLKEKEMLTIKR